MLGTRGGTPEEGSLAEHGGRREKKCGGGCALGLTSPRTQESGRASCEGSPATSHQAPAVRSRASLGPQGAVESPQILGATGGSREPPLLPKAVGWGGGSPDPLSRCRAGSDAEGSGAASGHSSARSLRRDRRIFSFSLENFKWGGRVKIHLKLCAYIFSSSRFISR